MDNTNAPALRRRHLLAGAAALGTLPAAQAQTLAARLPLTAPTTEGPFFLAAMPLRVDITEGLPGVPLDLRLRVTNTAGLPLPGLRVDVWQCDLGGLYAGFANQGDDGRVSTVGQTFLRGGQLSDADGAVVFQSIYPGWYSGRTTHIHFKVWSDGHAVLTSQFFLPDALSEFLYTSLPGYRRQRVRNVLNRTDGIALRAGASVVGQVREETDRYVASLGVVVDPAARPVVWRPGSGPPPAELRGPGGPPPGFGGTPLPPTPEGAERIRALLPRRGA